MGTVLDCVCIFQIDITEIHRALRFGVLAASIAFTCVRVSMVCFMYTVCMQNEVWERYNKLSSSTDGRQSQQQSAGKMFKRWTS